LSDAQREIVNIVLAVYKTKLQFNPKEDLPEILISIQKGLAGSILPVPAPSDYLYLVNMVLGTVVKYPCFIKQLDKNTLFEQANTYLGGTTTNPIVTVENLGTGKQFAFTPSVGTYVGTYLAIPIDITSTTVGNLTTVTQPTLPDQARNAMIQFAFSRALQKDLSYQEATQEYAKFLQMVQNL
jgi:hypothetical protein